jgi:hypothetical protein
MQLRLTLLGRISNCKDEYIARVVALARPLETLHLLLHLTGFDSQIKPLSIDGTNDDRILLYPSRQVDVAHDLGRLRLLSDLRVFSDWG